MATFKRSGGDSYDLFVQRWHHYSDKLSGPYAPRLLDLAGVGRGQRVRGVHPRSLEAGREP